MKYIRKKVEVICCSCSKSFLKDKSEVKRNFDLGRGNYCSRSCHGKTNTKHFEGKRDTSHLNSSNRKDEFTPFREHLRRVKRRSQEYNITLQNLKDVWELQNGKCIYSNVDLIHPIIGKNSHIYTASLDRIDSSKGYVEGNIQFISISMNYLKNSLSDIEMKELITIIKSS